MANAARNLTPVTLELGAKAPAMGGKDDVSARMIRPSSAFFAAVEQQPPLRVWNGIFAAGDRRAKRDLKTISPLETGNRRPPRARNGCNSGPPAWTWRCEFPKTGSRRKGPNCRPPHPVIEPVSGT
jgi:hypothetical protein